MKDIIKARRALLSVYDKDGITAIAGQMADAGIELVSTGGTAAAIKQAGIAVTHIEDVTGFPEILGGRLKTLHPRVFGGLLSARTNPLHQSEISMLGIGMFDIVVVNFYPFEAASHRGVAEHVIENIDIGGPSMIRAAAKNFESVCPVVDPDDYDRLTTQLNEFGGTDIAFRRELAAKAFARSAAYECAIANWFATDGANELAPSLSLSLVRQQTLRYGENPHQEAVHYRHALTLNTITGARQHQGKQLGYNNFADADAALQLASEFDPATAAVCVIVKHGIPCGVAVAADCHLAFRRAYDSDKISAFGGIVAFNRRVDRATASQIAEIFFEVIVAPDYEETALDTFSTRESLRVLSTGGLPDPKRPGLMLKQISGGMLAQERDRKQLDPSSLDVVTRRMPTATETKDMLFAWKVVKHAKSNAIVFAAGQKTLSIGAGQTSRIDAVRDAMSKASNRNGVRDLRGFWPDGLIMASDAFIPFPDGVELAAKAGARAIIQTGGSRRDASVIEMADTHDMAMVFTRIRHFSH